MHTSKAAPIGPSFDNEVIPNVNCCKMEIDVVMQVEIVDYYGGDREIKFSFNGKGR